MHFETSPANTSIPAIEAVRVVNPIEQSNPAKPHQNAP
jgi:hypothetical protein